VDLLLGIRCERLTPHYQKRWEQRKGGGNGDQCASFRRGGNKKTKYLVTQQSILLPPFEGTKHCSKNST